MFTNKKSSDKLGKIYRHKEPIIRTAYFYVIIPNNKELQGAKVEILNSLTAQTQNTFYLSNIHKLLPTEEIIVKWFYEECEQNDLIVDIVEPNEEKQWINYKENIKIIYHQIEKYTKLYSRFINIEQQKQPPETDHGRILFCIHSTDNQYNPLKIIDPEKIPHIVTIRLYLHNNDKQTSCEQIHGRKEIKQLRFSQPQEFSSLPCESKYEPEQYNIELKPQSPQESYPNRNKNYSKLFTSITSQSQNNQDTQIMTFHFKEEFVDTFLTNTNQNSEYYEQKNSNNSIKHSPQINIGKIILTILIISLSIAVGGWLGFIIAETAGAITGGSILGLGVTALMKKKTHFF